MQNLLSIITFIPVLAAIILAIVMRGGTEAADRNAKWFALTATSVTFLVSLFLLAGYDPNNTDFQFVEQTKWILGMNYKVGVDGISLIFVMLITFLMPITICSAWTNEKRVKEYMIAFLVLETFMIGVFTALDIVLFYLFFEASLIPMFLIIGVWGGRQRVYATFKFFLYTFLGSVLMLVGLRGCSQSPAPQIFQHLWNTISRQCRSMCWASAYRVVCRPCCSWPSSPRSR